jgi:pimeloyl-ACP methyl ester carboxylesterase
VVSDHRPLLLSACPLPALGPLQTLHWPLDGTLASVRDHVGRVSIAYTVAGSGKPLVRITGGLWDHAQGCWRVPPMRRQLERLAGHFTHIQYDARGTGLSQRGVADFGIEAQLRDLEAVVAANQLERFDLLAHFTGGFAALSYASRNPDKVAHMVLLRPHLRGSELLQRPRDPRHGGLPANGG